MPPPFETLGLAGGDKHAVVIDIGSVYTKCGYATEYHPRAIIPSKVDDWESGIKGDVVDFTRSVPEQKKMLSKFIHLIYYKYLLVAPKDRRLVIVESVLTPSLFRDTLASVLFNTFDVPSILYAPAHLSATFPLGLSNALVVDVGYRETLVLPIFEGVAMLNCWEASPSCAAKAVHSNLSSLMLKHCKVSIGQLSPVPVSECPEILTESLIEDVKVRTCFATHMDRGRKIQLALVKEPSGDLPTPPPGTEMMLNGDKILEVPGFIREAAAEVLFTHDTDEKSIPQLILDSLSRVPIDLRKTLADRILIMGGGAMLPGFLARLKQELLDLAANDYQSKLHLKSVKFFKLPAKENTCAWLGGSIFGALEILPHRSVSKEDFEKSGKMPDWTQRIADLDLEEEADRKGSRK